MGYAKAGWDLLVKAFWEWWEDNAFRLAASLAFYTLFSLAPLLLIAVTLLGIFGAGREQALDEVVAQLSALVGEQGGEAIREVAEAASVNGSSPWALAVGVVTLLVGSTVVFAELQAALNQIWDVEPDPNANFVKDLVRDRLRSFGIAVGVGFLLLVSLLLSAAVSGLQAYLSNLVGGLPWIWQAANLVVGFVVITLLFAMIYKFLPDAEIAWGDVIIGALVTAALFSVGKYFIGLYLGQAAVGSAYGAAGSMVVLLVWIYYSALVSFYGAEFTQVYARRHGSRIEPEEHAVRTGEKPEA